MANVTDPLRLIEVDELTVEVSCFNND